jgi:DNA-directed RNA polymerase beta subunit
MRKHEVVESYLSSVSMVQQQIESYNRFIHNGINKVVESQNKIEPDVSDFAIKLNGIRLEQPKIIESDSSIRSFLPHEALVRNLTYEAPMYLSYTPVISGVEKTINTGEAYIGNLPVMVKSDLCYTKNMGYEQLLSEGEDPDDQGGYFIIKGTERVLVGIEDLAPNKIICTKESGGDVVSKVFSATQLNFRGRCTITHDEYGVYSLMFPTLSKGLDLVLVLRALGLTTGKILEAIENKDARNDMLLNINISKAKDLSTTDAVSELGRMFAPNQAKVYQEKRAEFQLDTYILPHLGLKPEARIEKAFYLIRMAERASLVAYNYLKPDDRDNYANKRVNLAGDLMEVLFSSAFKFFIRDVKYHVERTTARGRKLTVRTNINPDTLTEKILYSMGTGSWPAGQTGVSQVLDRVNLFSSLSHLRRVKSPLTKKHSHLKARDVHGTHIGKICPSETPEGPEIGLTRYLALMAKVTVGADESIITSKLKELMEARGREAKKDK